MADYATKQDVEQIVEKAVGKAVEDLSAIIGDFAAQVDTRFNKVEADISEMKIDISEMRSDIDEVKTDISRLDEKYDRLLNTMDSFIKRIEDSETKNAARDAQIARLERWIEQIAQKTGIKLEY